MAIKYTPQMRTRDEMILKLYLRGWSYQRIANRYGLSIPRVYQILAKTGAKRAA